jgi:uncharacterized protein (DUF362 family)
MNSTVYLRRAKPDDIRSEVAALLDACRWRELVAPNASVVIKPNLCTERKERIPTANTSLPVLRSVCEVLKERTSRITIVESDGARYPAEAAFENNGVYAMARDLDVRVVNLSKEDLVSVPDPRLRDFDFARTWLEANAFITLPVLKTHATTVFTGALKNQWGCIPRYDRILLHKHLHELIACINQLRPVSIAIMDGLVGMQGRGPINGYPINLGVLLASRDPVALDASAMRLVGLDPYLADHILRAHQLGLGEIHEDQIALDGPFAQMRTTAEPAHGDWAISLMNLMARSRFLTKHLLLNDTIFYPVRRIVTILRRLRRPRAVAAR